MTLEGSTPDVIKWLEEHAEQIRAMPRGSQMTINLPPGEGLWFGHSPFRKVLADQEALDIFHGALER